MNQMRKMALLMTLGSVALVAEPSVYGNSGQYAAPQKSITKNQKMINALKRQVATQKERIDGLQSVVEGLSAKIHELEGKGATTASTSNVDNTPLLQELGKMIDKINAEYVSKEELKKALGAKGNYAPAKNETAKSSTKSTTTIKSLESMSTKKLYSEGVRLFVKKRYDESKKRFLITDVKGYKPAASNYYLGEIAYYTKQYEDAIFYFKKSAGLYDKASYIDTLLLHTGISLEKSGEKAQARAFYENIIANYKGKKTAKIAKEKLKKL